MYVAVPAACETSLSWVIGCISVIGCNWDIVKDISKGTTELVNDFEPQEIHGFINFT